MQINKHTLKALLPKPALNFYRLIRNEFNRIKYRGNHYFCNVCNSALSKWFLAGNPDHLNYVCPVCNSYGRQRMMVMVLNYELHQENFRNYRNLLHFAPEIGLQSWIQKNLPFLKYQSADLVSQDADLRLDLQQIALPDDSIDVVILSHVLEHVASDTLALNEIKRILSPGGRLFLQVPLGKNLNTIDYPLDSESERLIQYGQSDHVRLYGDDLRKKLETSGFTVFMHLAKEEPYSNNFSRMALDLPNNSTMLYKNESTTFICVKPFKFVNS